MEDRDATTLLSMAHPNYYEDSGTPSGQDDYGYDGLKDVLVEAPVGAQDAALQHPVPRDPDRRAPRAGRHPLRRQLPARHGDGRPLGAQDERQAHRAGERRQALAHHRRHVAVSSDALAVAAAGAVVGGGLADRRRKIALICDDEPQPTRRAIASILSSDAVEQEARGAHAGVASAPSESWSRDARARAAASAARCRARAPSPAPSRLERRWSSRWRSERKQRRYAARLVGELLRLFEHDREHRGDRSTPAPLPPS